MNQEEIIRMAREAGVFSGANEKVFSESLERFANLVAAHEREECAKFCRDTHGFYGFGHVFATGIRARGLK